MIVVSDSTPLIIFAKVNHFSLLRLLFEEIIIPQSVYNEVAVIGSGKAGACEVARSDWVRVERVQDQRAVNWLRREHGRLSRADAEAIILSQERQADFLLVDDRDLRKIAQTMLTKTAILYTGSVLIYAKREGFIDKVRDLLDEMREEGIWMDDEVYEQILAQAGES